MITEDYVSFETAKLLKKKGFDEVCKTAYETITNKHEVEQCSPSSWGKLNQVKRPTLQMAMKWLREGHNKHCDVGHDVDLKWFFQIIDLIETVTYDYPETKYYHAEDETGFKSYEEAVEEALKYTLENLI